MTIDVLKTRPVLNPPTRLVCAFGEDWLGVHPLCRAATAKHCGVSIEDVPDPDLSRYARVQQLELW